jgi:hypothetical protein
MHFYIIYMTSEFQIVKVSVKMFQASKSTVTASIA